MDKEHRHVALTPVNIGIFFATVGVLLAVVGIVRGHVPMEPRAILIALLISGGTWGSIAWAVARVAFDVEADTMMKERGEEQRHKE